jgi:hypothetical protein
MFKGPEDRASHIIESKIYIWKCIVIFMIQPTPEKELLVFIKQRVDWMAEQIWT